MGDRNKRTSQGDGTRKRGSFKRKGPKTLSWTRKTMIFLPSFDKLGFFVLHNSKKSHAKISKKSQKLTKWNKNFSEKSIMT